MSVQKLLTDERLWALFNTFNTDSTEFITAENLKEAFARLGRNNISDGEIKDIITEHDIEENGMISFTEFKLIFAGDEERELAMKELSPTLK